MPTEMCFCVCRPFTAHRQGDLGAIDEEYDIAISTACGPLDNIVVDTMDPAVKCVEFLRRNNMGVATFIGLDKVWSEGGVGEAFMFFFVV